MYYVLPFIEGQSLRERLDREPRLPIDEALRITRQAADALAYAHDAGIVHRDVKPENILFEAGHAVVADFGIAHAISEAAAGNTRLTESGLVVGTVGYMSPEQALSSQPVDGRADIYSLGCVLFEMLTGELPVGGPTPQAIIARKTLEPVPGIRALRAGVPAAVEAAVRRALAPAPDDRFATARDFAAALAAAATAATARPPLRGPLVIAASVIVVIAAAAYIGLALGGDRSARGSASASAFTRRTSDAGVEWFPQRPRSTSRIVPMTASTF